MQQRKSQTSELRPVLLCANITAGKTKVKKDRSGQSDLMSLSILWWPSNRFLLQLHLSLRSAQNKKERACIRSLYFHIKTGNKYVKWIQKFILLSSEKKKKTSGLAPLSLVFYPVGTGNTVSDCWALISLILRGTSLDICLRNLSELLWFLIIISVLSSRRENKAF